MSDQNDTVTTAFLSFLAGTLFGALAALLLAPSSGQELRGRIREEAERDWSRATAEWEKAKVEMQIAMDQMRAEAEAYQLKALEEVKARLDELQQAQSEQPAPSEPAPSEEAAEAASS
jgi:gas vesicle protein